MHIQLRMRLNVVTLVLSMILIISNADPYLLKITNDHDQDTQVHVLFHHVRGVASKTLIKFARIIYDPGGIIENSRRRYWRVTKFYVIYELIWTRKVEKLIDHD